jgi:hypothetical protein
LLRRLAGQFMPFAKCGIPIGAQIDLSARVPDVLDAAGLTKEGLSKPCHLEPPG